jgi:hypothetical protein
MHNPAISPDLSALFKKGLLEILPLDRLNSEILDDSLGENSEIQIEKILAWVEKKFGFLSASGLFFRSGSAAFKFLVRQFGKQIEIDSLEFRLQPQRKRLMDGTQKLIHLLESWHAGKFTVKKVDDLVEITVAKQEFNTIKMGSRIWLNFIAGLFQEYLYWAGGGKIYPFQIILPEQTAVEIIIQFRIVPED